MDQSSTGARTRERKRPKVKYFLAACAGLLLALTEASGVVPPAEGDLPNFDRRPRDGAVRAQAQAAHRDAVIHLQTQVADAQVEFDEILGTPKWVRSERGVLSGPNGRGRGVPTRAAAPFLASDPYRAAKGFLREHRALFGHGPEVLAGATIQREFVTPHSGMKTVVWEQRLDDIPIFDGLLVAHATRNDELVSLSSRFHPSPAQGARTGGRERAAMMSAS
jgi:hypothetical protein